jgi:DNA-binding FadR family transcriptional regulator
MQSLEQAGYVEIRHGRNGGSFVTYSFFKPFLDSIFDLFCEGSLAVTHFFQTRSHIERLSVALAVEKVTDRSIAHLKKINSKLLADTETYGSLAENNLEFHVAIAEIGGNLLNKLMVEALLNMLHALFPDDLKSREFVKATHENHAAIISALEKRDAALAERTMVKDTALSKELKLTPKIPDLDHRSAGRGL